MNHNLFSSGRWKDWFSFSRRERNGIIILLSLIIAESLVLFYLHYTENRNKPNIDFAQFQKEADKFFTSTGQQSMAEDRGSFSSIAEEEFSPAHSLFYFDPNKVSESELKNLGLPDKIARRILNYRSKGGKFKAREDLKKIYGLSVRDYKRLTPFIVITDTANNVVKSTARWSEKPNWKKKNFSQIDISTADTIELTRIHGVGEVFARRIYKYRNDLGGFYTINQLYEVYGISDSLFQIILPQVKLPDTLMIQQLNINIADYITLSKHPYIDSKLANLIISYRRQHNGYTSIDQLKTMPLVNEELYRKLAPYLKAE